MHHMSKEMQACIDNCLHCYQACLGMAMTHCLEAGGNGGAFAVAAGAPDEGALPSGTDHRRLFRAGKSEALEEMARVARGLVLDGHRANVRKRIAVRQSRD